MSNVKELTKKEFKEKIFDYEKESSWIYQGENVIIDFYADWCGPCKRFAPTFEESSQENQEIKHYKVNIDADPELASLFNIRSIPTLMFLKKGVDPTQVSGALSQEKLKEAIGEIFS